jgi:integrase/recombinase XerD
MGKARRFASAGFTFMEKEIKEYLAWKGSYATRACVNYKIWLKFFIEVCGNRKIETYNIEDIVRFKHWLETRYSSSSVQYAMIVIKNFFYFFKQQDCRCLSTAFIKIPPKNTNSHKAITEAEFLKTIAGISTFDFLGLRDSLIIRLLWDTGIRVSELCSINLSQIDENKHSMVIRSKKTQGYRIIVWSIETHSLLLKYFEKRQNLTRSKEAGALFIGMKKGLGWTIRLTKRSVERMVKKYIFQAGIKEKLSPHSFRHGWAHKRRDQNAPLAFIQKGLGHINPASTFIYEQYNDNEFESHANSYLKIA